MHAITIPLRKREVNDLLQKNYKIFHEHAILMQNLLQKDVYIPRIVAFVFHKDSPVPLGGRRAYDTKRQYCLGYLRFKQPQAQDKYNSEKRGNIHV